MENQIIQLKKRNKYHNERIVINQGIDKSSLKAFNCKPYTGRKWNPTCCRET